MLKDCKLPDGSGSRCQHSVPVHHRALQGVVEVVQNKLHNKLSVVSRILHRQQFPDVMPLLSVHAVSAFPNPYK